MKKANIRLTLFIGLIVAFISLLSLESQAAKKNSKSAAREKAKFATVSKSRSKLNKTATPSFKKPAKALASDKSESLAVADTVKVIRKPTSQEIPDGVPTELPEKLILYPSGPSTN